MSVSQSVHKSPHKKSSILLKVAQDKSCFSTSGSLTSSMMGHAWPPNTCYDCHSTNLQHCGGCQTVQCSAESNSTVQYLTVQYSIVQYSTVQYSVQYSTVQYSTIQHSTVIQNSTVLYKQYLGLLGSTLSCSSAALLTVLSLSSSSSRTRHPAAAAARPSWLL